MDHHLYRNAKKEKKKKKKRKIMRSLEVCLWSLSSSEFLNQRADRSVFAPVGIRSSHVMETTVDVRRWRDEFAVQSKIILNVFRAMLRIDMPTKIHFALKGT
jgi:hypothetical protein